MPNITIPNTPLVDGAVADADPVMRDVYSPNLVPNSLEVINGKLTNPNRDGWTIAPDDVRRGHFSQSGTASATANQDFFDDFLTLTNTSTTGAIQDQSMPIPGCSITFFVPWQVTAVALNWHLSLITDAGQLTPNTTAPHFQAGKTWLQLFVDGYPVHAVRRAMADGNWSMAYDPASPDDFHNDYVRTDTRDWSGSFVYDSSLGSTIIPPGNLNYIERGWHTASIRIAFPPLELLPISPYTPVPGSGIKQARVKSRRMGYTLIR